MKKGVFGLATDLYGLKFIKNKDIPVYHSEVEAFDVLDEMVFSFQCYIPIFILEMENVQVHG